MIPFLNKFKLAYQDYIPQSFLSWQEGYSKSMILNDLLAGFTVGVITIPLAMAVAIGSGVDPERGLYTAIVAGFLISLLGGSRVQIGGPTGAFIVLVYSIVERHGYDGLVITTLMAGLMMILMGIARFGVFLKFIPYSVTTGFTLGIALIIFTSQIKDFFGLCLTHQPADFTEKWMSYFLHCHTLNPWAFLLGISTLALIFFFRHFFPRIPGIALILVFITFVTSFFNLSVETIYNQFGEIPRTLPFPCFPKVSFDTVQLLFPEAVSVALLGAIESLLSAAVADGMTGHRHRSNCELIAQGLANIGSVFFGGIPATGAIARTAANVKLNAKTPLSGMTAAFSVLLLMLFLGPLTSQIPLAALAAILIYIAWNMCEIDHVRAIIKGPRSDLYVFLLTFLITILIGLTEAIQVGVILAAVLFLKRMSDTTTVNVCKLLLEENVHEQPEALDSDIIFRKDVPRDVGVFEINGPFFFGVADLLNDEWAQMETIPKVFILRMRKVPLIDATGIRALKDFHRKCQKNGVLFCLSGLRDEVKPVLQKSGVIQQIGPENIFNHFDDALMYVRSYLN